MMPMLLKVQAMLPEGFDDAANAADGASGEQPVDYNRLPRC
jgi:hypothetical protein